MKIFLTENPTTNTTNYYQTTQLCSIVLKLTEGFKQLCQPLDGVRNDGVSYK